MSSVPNNIFEEVQQLSEMGVASIKSVTPLLQNLNMAPNKVLMSDGSRSTIVKFLKQGRSSAADTLEPQFEGMLDRFGFINVNMESSAALAETDAQVLYFTKGLISSDERAMHGWNGYLRPKIRELGNRINNRIIDFARTSTWRYFGHPSSPINTYNQLVQGVTRLRLYGTTGMTAKAFLPMSVVPQIVQNGMTDFALNRNNKDSEDWKLSTSYDTEWYECTFMPQQNAGTVGNTNLTLTVVSTTVDANGGVTNIVFSGAPVSDPDAIKAGDKFQFDDSVVGFPNLRLVQFVGHGPVMAPVQNCVVTDAGSDGAGLVSVQLVEPLQASAGQLQNINQQIVAGMQVKFLPDHTVGFVMQGDPFMAAMAELENLAPFPCSTVKDQDTGVSLRLTYATNPYAVGGPLFGWNYAALYGAGIDADNMIAYIFPSVTSSF